MFNQKLFYSMLLIVSLFIILASFCEADMIAGWTFDEGGGNTAKDVTGNGHNGTVSSPKWVVGKIGGALEFNGDGDRVIVPNHEALNIKNEITLEAWVYPKDWNSELNCVVQKWGTIYQYMLSVYQQNNRSYISTSGGNWPYVQGKTKIPLNQWTHLATTYDGKKLRAYVNGKLDNEADYSGAIFTSNVPLLIGGYGPKTPECNFVWNRHFKGIIDEVRVWNTALSEVVIATNMSKSTTELKGGTIPPQEPPGEFSLIGTDQNEMPLVPNINQVFVKSESGKLYFKVTSHKNWVNNIIFAVFVDSDLNPNTGMFDADAGIGADYQLLIYLENGNAYGDISALGDTNEIINGKLGDVIISSNSNVIQFSVNTKDIGSPKTINFVAAMGVSFDSDGDLAPDKGYYTYKLDGNGTIPTACDAPVSIKGPSNDYVLIETDPDESQEANINQVLVYSDAAKIYFQVTTYKTIGNEDFSINVDMNTDQNKKTGHCNVCGGDYSVEIGRKDGKLFSYLWAWDMNKSEWIVTNSSVAFVPPPPGTNVFFFNANLKDINNPEVIDFDVVIWKIKSGKWEKIDSAPDYDVYCYYRYNLGETTTPADGRNLVIPEVTGSPGKSVTVPINISDASGTAGADINILYDPKILRISDANVKTTALSSGMNLISNANTPGKVIIRLAGTNAIASGSGSLVDMIFTIDASAAIGTETPVRFEIAELFGTNALNIAIKTQNGKVKVVSDCVKGDVNGDGSIKSNDAILALRISAGLMTPDTQQFCAADYNSDGQVKSNDAILILRKSAGLIGPDKNYITSINREISISFAEARLINGERVIASLLVNNPDVLAGGDICITYDVSVLKAVNVSFGHSVLQEANLTEPGVVRIAFAANGRLKDKKVAEIEFEILAYKAFNLTFQNIKLYGPDALPLNTKDISERSAFHILQPENNALLQNFPNPFNPETWIPYQLKEDCHVTIRIYKSTGELVRSLYLGNKSAGFYTGKGKAAYWDGKNEDGDLVASGVYFYNIQAGGFSAIRKMMVIR